MYIVYFYLLNGHEFIFLSKILFIINCNYNTIFIFNIESVCTVFCQFIIIYYHFSPTKISDFLNHSRCFLANFLREK